MNIYGAGGHAKVVLDCCKDNNISIEQVFDDNLNMAVCMNFLINHQYHDGLYLETPFIVAIGDNKIREKIAKKIKHKFGNQTHPSALISQTSVIKNGTVVFHSAVVQADSIIGEHVILNTGAIVDHESKVGDFAHIGPGVTICGNVEIGIGTFIGAGTTVIQGIRIGKWVTVGAGSVIIKDIPDYAVVVGNPGKIIKYADD